VYHGVSARTGALPWRRCHGVMAYSHVHRTRYGSIMPSLTISVPHSLGADEAAARLKNFFEKLKEQYQDKMSNLEQQWNGNKLDYSFSTFGFNIKGDLNVEPGEVKVNGSLPFAAMMFKGKIEQSVREQLEKLLA
jgi:putative polyhydroxyalkanoate system protein